MILSYSGGEGGGGTEHLLIRAHMLNVGRRECRSVLWLVQWESSVFGRAPIEHIVSETQA